MGRGPAVEKHCSIKRIATRIVPSTVLRSTVCVECRQSAHGNDTSSDGVITDSGSEFTELQ
jgi:hypothetical protein